MSKNRIFKTITALFCVFTLMLSLFVAAESENISLSGDEYIKIAENSALELYVKPSTTGFKVVDKNSGESWESCSQTFADDPYVGGIYMTEMQSLISVEYYDKDGVMNTVNSYASSVLNNAFELKVIKNGYRVEYNIEDGLLNLAMEVKLENQALDVDVFTSDIKIAEGYSISNISVLPFFMVGTAEDDGYLFVPDGCGGLISFDDDKEGIEEYSRRVYGKSISDDGVSLNDIEENAPITLPIYGIKRNNSAILCLIDNGDTMASINAYGAKRVSSLYNVYASFGLYSNMEYTFSANSVTIFEDSDISLCDISQKYFFLNDKAADYNGMAKKFRYILLENGTLKEKDIKVSPYLTVYGGITVKKSVFGILTDTVLPLTTTEQLNEIVQMASELGMKNPTVNYVAWNKQELSGKAVKKLKINAKVEKGVSFEELCENKDFIFVPSVSNLFSYTKSDNLIAKFLTPASNIAGTAFYRKQLSQTTFKEYGKRNYFLNKKYLTKNLSKFTKSALASDSEYIGLSDIASILYEDFGKDYMKRYSMKEIVTDKLEVLSKDKKLLFDNPNFYAYRYADTVINLPTATSGHLLIDRSIPFVQMVISGCVNYSCEPLNYTDYDIALLKVLETGSMPHYFMYYAEEASVKNTEYSSLGSGGYKKNLEKLQSIYGEILKVYEEIEGAVLINYVQLGENICSVTYDNGAVIYINYSDADYKLSDGRTVCAKGYVMEVAK